ncbi:hypothetical protein GTQ38_12510 [Flavobacteriaceae bacterium R33]|uniref:Uncharacterized protein n=2 Tax=Poritiphilus flavus TaxID=2697053 RepID=A0A6L9EDX7_9FLAO|nr:hypothetical protein [Poritiphilus flavus]
MAFLLLASTVSWTIEKHYCMGMVVDVALFSKAEGCGMLSDLESTLENSCCEHELIAVDGQDDLNHSWEQLDLGQQVFLYAFTYTYLNTLENLEELVVPHKEYPPPILIRDLQLLDQVFLI